MNGVCTYATVYIKNNWYEIWVNVINVHHYEVRAESTVSVWTCDISLGSFKTYWVVSLQISWNTDLLINWFEFCKLCVNHFWSSRFNKLMVQELAY